MSLNILECFFENEFQRIWMSLLSFVCGHAKFLNCGLLPSCGLSFWHRMLHLIMIQRDVRVLQTYSRIKCAPGSLFGRKKLTAVTYQCLGFGIPRCWCCMERGTCSSLIAPVIPGKWLKACVSAELKPSQELASCPICSSLHVVLQLSAFTDLTTGRKSHCIFCFV